MNVLIVAGMIDRKLFSKIEPIISHNYIKDVFLVRNTPYFANKIRNHYPTKKWSKIKILNEIYKVVLILKILFFHNPKLIIGIGLIPHGLYSILLGKIFKKRTILLLMGKNDLYLTFPSKVFIQKKLLWIASYADKIGTRGES